MTAPLAVLLMLAAPAEVRRMALDDLERLVRLEEPQLSPDGRQVALLVGRANLDENRYETELVLVDARSGAQRTLVSTRPGLASPRFSPAGDRVAFIADVHPGGGKQVFAVPLAGGDAQLVTGSATGVLAHAWSPDGKEVAFIAEEEVPPRQGAARFEDAFEVGHAGYLERRASAPAQLYVVSATGGEARRVTQGPGSLATGLGPSTLSWSPDARTIAVVRFASADSGDHDRSRIERIDVASGAAHAVTGRVRHEASPVFSPDGTQLAWLYPRNGDPTSGAEALVGPAPGGEGRSLSRGLDRNLLWLQWRSDGHALLVGGNDGTRVALWQQPLQGPARRVDLGPVVEVADFSQSASGAVAFVGSEEARPNELYVLDAPSAPPRRLTDFHAELAALALGRTESLSWKSEDGFVSDGALTVPPDFDPRRRYPLVLAIHGGPTTASNTSFSALAQLMAARGWIVLQPNYRGSDNLGDVHLRGIVAGAGEGPGKDVLAGVAAVKARGIVDAERIAVSGWSYGGFMTGWMIGRYPGLWRAAVAGAAALDLFDMYALSDLNVMPRHAITGSPWTEGREAHYRAQSPLTYASQVRTPTLILSTVGDSRVTVTQSYKLFRALEDNDVTVKFVVYPTSGHWPPGPVRRRDVYRRWLEWIEEQFAAAPSR